MASGEAFGSVLAAAQAGAEWAFGALYHDYNPRLLRYFASRAPGMADDLAADTWLGASRGLRSFEGDEQEFRSWLFTIAHRRLADHWRQRSVTAGDEPLPGGDAGTSGESPEDIVLAGASAQVAARRIASVLSPEHAEVILLRVVAGLDVDQVAEILGKRPGAVRVLQHRALKKLVKEMSLEDVTG